MYKGSSRAVYTPASYTGPLREKRKGLVPIARACANYPRKSGVQSNLDYPNPFAQGEISNRSDNIDHAQATPTKSIMHAKTYILQTYKHFDDFNLILD